MSIASRLLPRTAKGIAITASVVVLLGVAGWLFLPAWWYSNVSSGMRTGVLRKISYKGSPMCKYWSGEMDLANSTRPTPELWEFTVDGPAENNPIVQALQKAEATAPGKPMTVSYRQSKGRWWACAPTEYHVTGVVSVGK